MAPASTFPALTVALLDGDNRIASWTWQQKFLEWEQQIRLQSSFTGIVGRLSAAQLPAAGISGTVALAKITGGGSDGSLTFVNGQITAKVDPT